MTALDRLIAQPRLVEIDRIDLAGAPAFVWERLRHGNLAQAAITRALFALRSLASHGESSVRPGAIRLDDMASSPGRPGFQILMDDAPREVAVGAIGEVWRLEIPFVHVADAAAFAAFDIEGKIKVAWALRVSPLGSGGTHVELEVRVAATSDAAWHKFRRYFALIGPASRRIRRALLGDLAREFGRGDADVDRRPLAGDDCLPDASAFATHVADVAATPEAIWPWLVQMGCRRAGFYSLDLLDNGGRPSAREIRPELQRLAVGDVIPATPRGTDGFEVVAMRPPFVLVLGGLYDVAGKHQLPFSAHRPTRFWHATWTFVLEPLDARSTRILIRVRVAHDPSQALRVRWTEPVHAVMQWAQLRNLARRVEGRLPEHDWRDVVRRLASLHHGW